MEAIVIGLLGLVGKLVAMGAQAYEDAQKKHDELVAAVETGLSATQSALDQYKASHAQRMADARAQIDAIAAHQSQR